MSGMATRATAAFASVAMMLALGAYAVGSAQGSDVTVTHEDAPAEEACVTMQEAAEQFPLEFSSSQMSRVNAKGITIGHTVGMLRDICEAPVARDVNGDIDWNDDGTMRLFAYEYNEDLGQYVIPDLTDEQLAAVNLKVGCLSCKTHQFTDLYELMGPEAYGAVYNADARAVVDNEYWDCAMCHTGTPSAESLSANQIYFAALGEGLADQLEPKMAVCAQCHNSYDYRSRIHTEEDLDTFRPYRYGNDVDAVFESAYEDGVNFFENDLGLPESYVVHPNVEGYMQTTHYKMGVTCVDCHMPVTTDEATGTQYRTHFSANSPIESEDSLAYCLTCHAAQGIEDTQAMAEFVTEKKEALGADIEALKTRVDEYGQAVSEAIAGGSLDEASVETLKRDYAKATWNYQVLITGPYETAGSQVAMLDSAHLLEDANAAIDEGMALL